ncbi:MAG TPA: LD-carboxypeptidase [Bacteroidia bacterium]|jgi:muramoyltetrapeptide carboxypeptidase|nr:LD-carboxypeptidase [Bacteroidia bacterium]
MNIPPYLKSGDKVAIVASSRKVSETELAFALKTLVNWGLQPVAGKHLYAAYNQWAGTDQQRADDLQWAIDDESIKAIFFARGGNGIIRIIDKIDFTKLNSNLKWFVGYSDVTILHAHLHKFCKTASLHANMLTAYSKNAEATESIRKCLFGEKIKYDFTPDKLNREGKTAGVLIGGNISLLHTLSATPEDLDTKGKILFIEDLDENLHHLDRMIHHLKRTGKLAHLAGLVVGGLNDMKDDEIPFGITPEEIIMNVVKEYNYPVCFNFPAGHIERNLALYLGKEIKLDIVPNKCLLEY